MTKDLIERARSCIGVSVYERHARLSDAPRAFNCFRFTQWLWLHGGRELPDHQLVWPGGIPILLESLEQADLVFVPLLNRIQKTDNFGHVGVYSGNGTVIHATKWRDGVVEDPLSDFIARGVLGIRRIPL